MWVDVCRERVVRMVNIITESIMVDTNMPIVGDISECLLFLIFFFSKMLSEHKGNFREVKISKNQLYHPLHSEGPLDHPGKQTYDSASQGLAPALQMQVLAGTASSF